MTTPRDRIVRAVKQAVITAETVFRDDQIRAYQRAAEKVIREAARWAAEGAEKPGCQPVIPCIGIGRTHHEATVQLLKAMRDANLDHQTEWEQLVTDTVNATGAGALGLRGDVTALGSFVKVGPQRASGMRYASVRPCCAVDPRRGVAILKARDLAP